MYFVNQNKFVVYSSLIEAANVDNVETFVNDKALIHAYPNLKNKLLSEIPMLHQKESESDSEQRYYISSSFLKSEPIDLDFLQEIEDWVENQDETYHIEDGMVL